MPGREKAKRFGGNRSGDQQWDEDECDPSPAPFLDLVHPRSSHG
jgi:hypothetical protein